MTQKQLIQGAGDGTAVPAGHIGETLTATGTLSATTAAYLVGATLTLTTGVWSFSAVGFVSGAAGFTGLQSRLNLKGAASYVNPLTALIQSCPSGGYAHTAFPTQTVVVASADADKTIKFEAATLGANSTANIFISAVRIA